VLEIPVAARDADEDEAYALRQYYALFHGKPRLDGASGFVSPAYREFRRVAQSFPDPPALDAARDLGARLVVVHYGDLKPEERAGIAARVGAEPRLTRLATFGDDAVFALQPP
jgi:sugar phosphate isomerase/epimerase